MENLSLKAGESFNEVMRHYMPTVYRIAFTRLQNRTDAEDVSQEVFLRYFNANKDFDSEEHRKAFLIRCAVNCTNTFAQSAWYRRRAHSDALENFSEDEFIVADKAGETAVKNEARSRVLAAVMRLSPKYRTAVHLFYFEDMTIAQIAKATDTKENTVKSQLLRAREMLKAELADVEFE